MSTPPTKEEGGKPTRASVACNLCRESKLKCMNNNDNTTCQRCTLLDLNCSYTLKKSQLKKRKLSKKYIVVPTREQEVHTPIQNTRAPGKNRLNSPSNFSPSSVVLPDKSTIIEVAEIYFENQYKGIFPHLHKPSLLSFIRSAEFNPATYFHDYYNDFFEANYSSSLRYPDPVILLAIFALCARLHPEIPKIYGEFSEDNNPEQFVPNFKNRSLTNLLDNDTNNAASNASNYFGWHARNTLKEVFDSPTIQRVQALTILSSHEWGEGNVSRSFLYVGIAARMALVLGLGTEERLMEKEEDEKLDESSKFICIESKRRTMWAVYMMDRCNSSGRNRHSCIKLDDIDLRLPCTEKDFIFGNYRQQALTFSQINSYIHDPEKHELLNQTSCFGFLIILFETWAKIAKWVGETGGKLERLPPWDEDSPYYKLSQELNIFRDSLPSHLRFSNFNLEAHIADGSAADFGYFHGLFFLCRIFLNREYFFCTPESFPEGWWEEETRTMIQTLDDLSYITKTLKPINMMVIAPFTGFQVFTCASTSLYIDAFPRKVFLQHYPFKSKNVEQDVDKLKSKYKSLADESMETLLTWKKVWGLGSGWYETCLKLQKLFNKVAKEKSSALQDDDLRHSMHDYGDGKVQEMYKPEYIRDRKKDMHISNLLVADDDGLASPRVISGVHLSNTVSNIATNSSTEDVNSGFNSPSLDFMNNFDLSNIFPGWSDAMKT
ncbi:fungal-specific transcription factor domain-containing protein [Scheffersomyces xylosifermentans]|uniref:fungal-specific transcription factor domain-containing protein n=1 Tax=Scheffersomyces xylosifermentans TaxID=1304137 RepID=UPI00315C544B